MEAQQSKNNNQNSENDNPLASLADVASAAPEVVVKRKKGRPKGSKDSKPRRRPGDPPPIKVPNKRGRPKGRVDTKPRKKPIRNSVVVAPPKPPPSPMEMVEERQAREAKEVYEKSQIATQKAREALAAAQTTLAQAELAEEEAKVAHHTTVAMLADSKLENDDDCWVVYYKSFQDYKEKHGQYALVPRGHDHPFQLVDAYFEKHPTKRRAKLSTWVEVQREAEANNEMPDWQIHLLNRFDFKWRRDARGPNVQKWMRHYNQLKEFHQQHGHCRVPKEHELLSWTQSQKCEYRNRAKGKKPALSDDRVELLKEIHFEFGEPRQTYTWEMWYQELCAFVQQFGHANVSRSKDGSGPYDRLASWVNKQRCFYKDMNSGKPSNMTQERVEKLEAIGFQWSAKKEKRQVV